MRSLITGIDGFVGHYLETHLRELGHEVFGIGGGTGRRKYIFYGDIREKEFVAKTMAEIKPDRVFHLAGISFVAHGDIREIYDVNFIGTLNLYEALKALNREVKVLFISSSNVYGAVPRELQPMNENCDLNPINHYAVSKACGEMLSRAYAGTNLQIVIARPFNHTGIGQNLSFIVPKIVQTFRSRQASIKLGNIKVWRDFSDVRDVVRAYASLLEHGSAGEAYNVCSGKAYSITEVIKSLESLSSHSIRIEQDLGLIRSSDIDYVVGENTKIRNATSWEPEIEFRDTLNWMLHENRD